MGNGIRTAIAIACAVAALSAVPAAQASPASPASLRYFGYYDSGFHEDDLAAVAAYTNFAFTYLNGASRVAAHGLRAIVYLDSIAHLQREYADTAGNIHYASDVARFKKEFRAQVPAIMAQIDPNGDGNTADSSVLAFYMTDEPTWNGVDNQALAAAAKFVKRMLRAATPAIPILLVEAAPGLGGQQAGNPQSAPPLDARKFMRARIPGSNPARYVDATECTAALRVPAAVDWVAFDTYAVRDPRADAGYQAAFKKLKQARASAKTKLFVVMDAWWHPGAHGAKGIAVTEMGPIARHYFQLAKSDPDVVGIAAWVWDGRNYGPQNDPRGPTIGAKDFPADVLAEHRRIGARITGK